MKYQPPAKCLDHHIGKKHMGVEIEKNEELQFIRIDDYWLKVMMVLLMKVLVNQSIIFLSTLSCVFFHYHMEIQTQNEVSPLTNSYLIHMGTLYLKSL